MITNIWTKNKGPVKILNPNQAEPPKVQNNQNPTVLNPAILFEILVAKFQDK